jgi:hypothetical protein
MSSFFLTNNLDSYKKSMEEMSGRGLEVSGTHEVDGKYFASFKKRSIDNKNYLKIDNNNFIAVSGSFIYNGKVGLEALQIAFQYFNGSMDFIYHDSLFQGALVICKDGKINIAVDKYNVYWVYYYNINNNFYISSSLSSTVRSLDEKILDVNRYIEAIIQRGTIGNKMFYEGVYRLFGNEIISIDEGGLDVNKVDHINGNNFSDLSVDSIVQSFSKLLLEKYGQIYKAFGNDIGIHLTGGFDSRLHLAVLLKLGCRPTILYAVGNNSLTSQFNKDKDIVERLVKKFNLKVHYMDWSIDGIVDKEQTRRNVNKYGFNANENYCNDSWYKEYIKNTSNVKVILDGHMGELLNIEGEDGIFGEIKPDKFNPDKIFEVYQGIFFNDFHWRSDNKRNAHIKYLKKETNNIAKNIFKIPVDIKEIGMQYYQEYWHTRYRPADAHPTNLFNDFMYAYSPLGDAELQDFALKIPFDMITKRGLSIKLIENMMPGLSKVEFFSRAGKIKIVNNKIIRIQGSSMYKLLKFIHKLTPRFLISAYRYFKKMYIAKQPVTRNIQREFYVKWLNNDKLLGGLFDFSKQKGSVRRLATCAIYSDLVNSIGYDKKK